MGTPGLEETEIPEVMFLTREANGNCMKLPLSQETLLIMEDYLLLLMMVVLTHTLTTLNFTKPGLSALIQAQAVQLLQNTLSKVRSWEQ